MKATEAELARLLARAPFAPDYGFRVAAVADGQCTIEVPFRPSFERPGGVVSGPVFMAAADAAMWLAILARLGVDDPCVTVEMTTAFLAAARREDFRCTARVLKWGRRLIYGTAECVGAGDRLLTHHTLTYVRPDPGSAAGGEDRNPARGERPGRLKPPARGPDAGVSGARTPPSRPRRARAPRAGPAR